MRPAIRLIHVDGQDFLWRFDEKLTVMPKATKGARLIADWGWQDWLEPNTSRREPVIVTPAFVASVIGFALANGWRADVKGPTFHVTIREGQFVTRPFASNKESPPRQTGG